MNREEKASIVSDLSEKFAKATIAVATDYRGLTVPALEAVRRELKKNNAEVQVAKNTLLRRAVAGTSFEAMQGHFSGTTAITLSYDDPVAPAKILSDFVKDYPKFAFKTAVLDGRVITEADLMALAKLPSRDVLLSKLLSVMQAVPTNFVQVLAGVPRKMLYLLQAVKDQKEQA